MAIRTEQIPRVTAVGSAGSGVGSQKSVTPLYGMLKSIGVAQGNTPHADTDITISVANVGGTRTLFTLTNYNTTTLTWFNPRAAAVNQSNVALVFAASDPVPVEIPINGHVTVAVASGGSAATCDVTLIYED
jgi:hypothetical protein